jgi:eukaryotic-like serine/threonine-protein kinase
MQGDFRVEGYDIEGLLGAGPAGEVWLAREESSGTQVALKRLRPRDAAAHDEARRIIALQDSLRHPHLLPVREMLSLGGELVFVLDYAEGGSLAQLLLVRGQLDPGEVVGLATAAASALAAVHAEGMVHADLTPDNILFDAHARTLLADLGLVRLVDGGESGTLGYTDPARESGTPPTPASDIYGLAAVCYAALAGVPPEPGHTHRPLHQVAPGVPPGLAHAIEAGLQAGPGQRPDAEQFGAQLAAACPGVPVRFPSGQFPDGEFPESQFPESRVNDALHEASPPDSGGMGVDDERRGVRDASPVVGQEADPWTPGDRARQATPPDRRSPTPLDYFPSAHGARPPDIAPVEDGDDGDEEQRRRRLHVAWLAGVPVALAVLVALTVVGWRVVVADGPTGNKTAEPAPPTAGTSAAERPQPSSSPRTPAEERWTNVLTSLDERRAEAWRKWDEQLLARVYQPDSRALQEELDLMQVHASKDVTSVVDLRTPILSLDVVSEDDDKVVVEAVSQLQPYRLEMGGRYYRHEGGDPRRFRMTLEPAGSGEWLIAESVELGPSN